MSSIDDLVDLDISAETQAATTPAFGVVVVVCDDAGFGELHRTYNDPDDIDADGDFDSVPGIRLAKLVLQQDPNCGTVIVLSVADSSALVGDTTAVKYTKTLTDAVQAGLDFFGVALEDNAAAVVLAVSTWAETNRRMFIAAPDVTTITTDWDATATTLRGTSPKFTLGLVSKLNNEGDLAAALFGRVFAALPGSINWTHRSLSGVVVDTLSSSERAALKAQGSGWYETVAGLPMTRGGTSTYEGLVSYGGHYPDIIRGTEWLSAQLRAAVVTLLNRVDKVPFTDEGAAMIYNALRPVLSLAESNAHKLLVPGTTLYVPPAAELPTDDRGQRHWTGITFDGVFQGAVNKVRVRGRVTV